jgi:hypothetical protein
MEIDPQRALEVGGHGIAAHRLAGFGLAQFQHMPTRRLLAIVMIEGDDAVDFRAGDVQTRRDRRQGLLRHMAELFLNLVQDRQQRSLKILEVFDDGRGAVRDFGTCGLNVHAAALPCQHRQFLLRRDGNRQNPADQYVCSVDR